tara:strand:+ start:56 stop:313 length:258 start_codon:yes stop_codon:yes gene_type:complete
MNNYKIQFINGYIEVEERESPNGTPEAKCTLHTLNFDYGLPPYEPLTTMLFQEVVAWAKENNYTHTKLLMLNGAPYVVVWNEVVA